MRKIQTWNSSQGIEPHSSHETAATCKRIADNGPRFCRISSTVDKRNVTIETRSRRLQVLPSDGSDGDDMFVLKSTSSHISLATSTLFALVVMPSELNGLSLPKITSKFHKLNGWETIQQYCLPKHDIHAISSFVIGQNHNEILWIRANVTLNGNRVAHIIGDIGFKRWINWCHETREAFFHWNQARTNI